MRLKNSMLILCTLAGATAIASLAPLEGVGDAAGPNQASRAEATVEYRIVGLTQIETTGEIEFGELLGVVAADAICREEFGPAARMAKTSEARTRFGGHVDDDRVGWIAPTLPYTVVGEVDSEYVHPLDAEMQYIGARSLSPRAAFDGAACFDFLSGSEDHYAPVLGRRFSRLAGRSCRAVLPIHCAAPVLVPIQIPVVSLEP